MSYAARTFFLVFFLMQFGEVAKSDDLFSEVTVSSVFSDDSDDETIQRQKTGRRLTGSHSVRRILAEAGFVPKELVDELIVVDITTTDTKEDALKVAVAVSEDREAVLLTVALAKLDKASESTGELQELLKSRHAKNNVYYEHSSGWLRARLRLENKHVSASWLKTKISELIETVEDKAQVWRSLGKSFDQVVTENTHAESLKKLELEGTWTATANGKRYGLKFEGSKFRLGIVANGKITKSEGTWNVSDSNLTLKSGRLSLAAKVSVVSNDRLDLKFGTQPTLRFQRNQTP